EHAKSAHLLEKFPEPREASGAQEGSPGREVQLYRAARLVRVRELRLSKEVKQARVELDELIGADEKNWGARNIDALLLRVQLLEDEGQYVEAARQASRLVRSLLPRATTDNTIKEHYLEAYYHVVYCLLKHGQKTGNDKELKDAAARAVELEKKWPDFGTDDSRQRFTELLEKEPEFKALYNQLKGE